MKNLLIYISPDKKFNDENASYVKIQIENSLQYWDKKDLILATNFPYSYMGVDSTIVPDDLFSDVSRCAVKVNVIAYLLEKGLLNELTWFHDTEAWQVSKLRVELIKDLGLTDYGWSPKWNGGSMFFFPKALDIFQMWKKAILEYQLDDERSLMKLTESNTDRINDRIERMNITYNIGRRKVEDNILEAHKPLRVLHFHPYRENLLKKFEALVPDHLLKLFYEKDYRSRQ